MRSLSERDESSCNDVRLSVREGALRRNSKEQDIIQSGVGRAVEHFFLVLMDRLETDILDRQADAPRQGFRTAR